MILPLMVVIALQNVPPADAAAAAQAATVAAAARSTQDEPPLDCAGAASTPEINECAARDLERETARMEQYLAAARARAADFDAASLGDPGSVTQQTAYLEASQAAWVAYSTIVCAGVRDQWKGGTIRGVMNLGCHIAMTHERTLVIWRDHLANGDYTSSVLPEPVAPVASE